MRKSNIELYRIIVMMAIVAHHYVVNSGLYGCCPPFFYLFGMWGKAGINCFVLITGYFMCQSRITLRKFLKLLLQIEFYSIAITLIFILTGYEGLDYKESIAKVLMSIIPIHSVESGFTSCFLLFWLSISFLNVLIHNINRKEHFLLICLCLFIYTIVLYIPPLGGVSMNYVSWFIVLYFISSYIRLYPEKVYHSQDAKTWGWFSMATILLAITSVPFTLWVNVTKGYWMDAYWLVSDSNAILALLVGISTFMFFKNLRMPQSKFINSVAATTFGVLCIHAHSNTMRQWLWKDVVDCVGHATDTYYYLYAPISVICVFSICSLIDYMRIQTLEKWVFKWIDRKILTH